MPLVGFIIFNNNFIKAGFVKEMYGIAHSSNYQTQEVGRDKRLTHYEDGILPMANKIFTNSEYTSKFFKSKTINIGLPLQNNFKKPKTENNKIIFNHRISKEKGFQELIDSFLKVASNDDILKIVGDGPELKNLKLNYN